MQSTDTREMTRIYNLYDPWIAASPDREAWAVTLTSGATVHLLIPLGAAIEIEAAGFAIRATA